MTIDTATDARIDRLWPDPAERLTDEDLLACYPFPAGEAWLRMNFISSLDGAATQHNRSGGLGDAADRRLFELLRRSADVILLGAGTARIEGYGAMRLDAEAETWRRLHGLDPQPVFALVSHGLRLDPGSPIFADAPVRPIVYTVGTSPREQRAALARAADVVISGADKLEPGRVRADLAARGLAHIHSEGGPTLFGSFVAERAVDELCLTLAPSLQSGEARRIATAAAPAPTDMRLASALRAGDELLLRYVREDS